MQSEFEIGDEVIDEYGIRWAVVRKPYQVGYHPRTTFVQLWRGNFMSSTKLSNVKKTGRHYPQVPELIEALERKNKS